MADNQSSARTCACQRQSQENAQDRLESALSDLRKVSTLLEIYIDHGKQPMFDHYTRETWAGEEGIIRWLSERIEESVEEATGAFYDRQDGE